MGVSFRKTHKKKAHPAKSPRYNASISRGKRRRQGEEKAEEEFSPQITLLSLIQRDCTLQIGSRSGTITQSKNAKEARE